MVTILDLPTIRIEWSRLAMATDIVTSHIVNLGLLFGSHRKEGHRKLGDFTGRLRTADSTGERHGSNVSSMFGVV